MGQFSPPLLLPIGSSTAVAHPDIVPVVPLPNAVGVPRVNAFSLEIQDPDHTLAIGTIDIRYRQQPFPAESVDGWVDVVIGGVFQPGFDGPSSTITLVPFGAGEKALVQIKPDFGLLPGSTGSLEVTAEDSFANSATETWSFDVSDDAASTNLRDVLYRLGRQAQRFGWEDLITARSTYNFDVDPAITGADIEVNVNESLVADIADQISEDLFDIDILNSIHRYRLLAKPIEYARDSADANADTLFDGFVDGAISSPVFVDRKLPGTQTHEVHTDGDRIERQFRYYNLFILIPPTEELPDWVWVYADNTTFARAFAYGRYGHGAKLYSFMPEAWQVIDGDLP
jgi:hypothetical protein